MSVALENGVVPDVGDAWNVNVDVVGPTDSYPPELAEVRELRTTTEDAPTEELPAVPDDEPDVNEDIETNEIVTPAPVETAPPPTPTVPVPAPTSTSRFGQWVSESKNAVVGNMASAAFVTGLLGSGLGQLSYWTTKFPFWLAISFALTFELAMVGISRRVRIRKINELPAGALHFIGWMAALGAAGWNLIHLSDPTVVVRFDEINGGAPLFHGGPVVGASFATLAMLGFLIHEQSEKYHVEDALARKGRKIQRIGAARAVNYPVVSWTVWRNRVADPTLDVDAEFLRVLRAKRGEKILNEVEVKPPQPSAPDRQNKSTSKPDAAPAARSRSEAELDKLVDGVLAADNNEGRIGFRRIQTRFGLTQADARKLRSKADAVVAK